MLLLMLFLAAIGYEVRDRPVFRQHKTAPKWVGFRTVLCNGMIQVDAYQLTYRIILFREVTGGALLHLRYHPG